jgi:hypothetical protein
MGKKKKEEALILDDRDFKNESNMPAQPKSSKDQV